MLKFDWLSKFPGGTIEGVVEYLNNLSLGVSWGQRGNRWWVATGEKLLLETNDEETAQAFLMGMALSYIALPEEILEQVRARFGG
jgi:hypothetical protein